MTNKSTLAQGLSHAWPWIKPIGSSPTASRLLRYSLLCMLVLLCGGSAWAEDDPLDGRSPEVTLDFTSQSDWDIPTSGSANKDLASFTNGTYSIKLYATTNYKLNAGYLILGKSGSYLELPVFDFDVDYITVEGTSGASGDVKQNIYVGDVAVSTVTTGAKNVTNRYAINENYQAAGKVYVLKVTSNHNTQISKINIYKKEEAGAVKAPVITPTTGTYTEAQDVTISCATSGATIYYTLDGSDPSADNGTEYKASFNLTETKTVKAIAIKGDKASSITIAELTINIPHAFTLPWTEDWSDYAADDVPSKYTSYYGQTDGSSSTKIYAENNAGGESPELLISKNNGSFTIKEFNLASLNGEAATLQLQYNANKVLNVTTTTEGVTIDDAIVNGMVYTRTINIPANTSKLNLTFTNSLSSNIRLDNLSLKVYTAPKAPTFDPAAGAYDGTQNVTITCETSGADIYYSTDGENFTKYTAPIEVAATTTIYACSQVGEEKSATVSAAYTIKPLYTTIADILNNITDKKTNVNVQMTSWLVTYVKGSNTYVSDGTNAFLFYGSDLGLNAGDKITGTATGDIYTYNGLPEMAVEATGLNVTKDSEDNEVAYSTITPADMQSYINKPVIIENAKFVSAGTGKNLNFKVGETDLAVYNNWSIDVSALAAGKKYTLTGIGAVYVKNETTTYQLYLSSFEEQKIYIFGVEDLNEDSNTWSLPADMKEMTWNAENEAYEYTLNNTSTAYFCFSQTNEITENDWTTFNSTYRWAYSEGGFTPEIDTETQLNKVTGGNDNIVLPAGQWTISVTADMIMTITGEATPVTPTEAKYYVVGTMTDWQVDESYEMTRNEGADIDEYSFTMDLTTESQFKVVKVEEGKENVWYPDGMGNGYGENGEITADGTYTIYFRPNYDGGDDWFYNCIYVAVEEVPEPFVFRDIKLDLTEQGLLTDAEWASNEDITAKLLIAEGGEISRDDDAATPNATLTGHPYQGGTSHGWKPFTMVAPVTGKVKISIGGCNFNGSYNVLTVTPEGGEAFTIEAPATCYAANNENSIGIGYYDFGDNIVNVTFTGPQYTPYIAVEAVDEIPVQPSSYNVTFAAEGAEGVVPAAVEIEAGSKVTIPANYTLYKEGYTLTGWNDGTNNYAAGAEITPEADMTLNAVFTKNNVSLSDRTEAVTVTYTLDGSKAQYGFQGGTGIIVTQTTVNEETIDVKAATSGKFAYNGDGWHQMNNGSLVTVPSCKDATIVVNSYYKTADALTFAGSNEFDKAGETDGNYSATYTATTDDATVEIAAIKDNTYINSIVITLPAPQEEEIEGLLYSWESPNGTVKEKGGTATAKDKDGADITSSIINKQTTTGLYTIKVDGKADYTSGNVIIITLDKKLHAGDIISVTGCRDKNATDKATGFKAKFDKGGEVASVNGTDFVNVNAAVSTAEEYSSEPNTCTFTVPEAAEGSKVITITRSHTSTNLWISKLVITTEVEDDPNAVETPVITPATGTYTTEKEVTITCETEGATIYYTTDGSNPTAESTEYTEAFTVTETTTIKAIAIKGEYSSEIAESVITIVNIQPGESNLEWDYTDKNIPEEKEDTDPMYEDNGLFYASFVNDAAGTNNGLHGVKLNSSGYAWFTKNPVEGKLTLTFGPRKNGSSAYAVNVYACTITDGETPTATKGNLIGEIAVEDAPGTGSLDIPAAVTGIYIERKSTSEGVLQKIVFKEKVARKFKDFEITNDQLKGTVADMNLPEGVTLTGTQPAAGNNDHGYSDATITVPTDGGAVKFTIGGCQYANKSFTVTNSNNETIATLSNKTTNCYHQDASVVTYFYTGEATTLTFSTIPYLPYFKAEAVEVEEVTVTYKDQNGEVLGTKKVIEGSAIGEAPCTEADLTIAEGYAFRGWIYTNGVKVKATDIVDGNKTVMASVTAIEEAPTTGSIQVYDLTQSTFYPEDHENFDVNGGSWHDGQHGFSFGNGNSFSVKVSSKAQVVVTLCQHSSEGTVTVKDANNNPVGEGFNAKVASCGETAVVKYEGDATTLTFTFAATAYIHDVKVYNVNVFPEKDEATGYYMVPAGDAVALVLAINSASAEANSKIFLPNGTYDLGESTLTPISGTNVSIIGESMEGVIIKNAPPTSAEGLGKADLFKNTSEGLYLQDLTLQNGFPYTGNDGRAPTLHDMGTKTINKNVRHLSYQDTYYSHKTGGLYYFEGGEIHGTVDYMCGNGKAYFNEVTLVNERRSSATMTANSELYVFNNCTVKNNADEYNFGRAWSDNPVCVWLNTTLEDPSKLATTRWNLTGINCDYSIAGEYGTKNADGGDITPESNNITFKKANTTLNTILSADQAATYTINYVLGDWAATAQEQATQVAAPKAQLSKDGKKIEWTPANDGATAYAIFKDGKFLGITTGSEWTIEEVASAPALRRAEEPEKTGYTIRAANGRGGFGQAAEVSPATGIAAIEAELGGDVKIYDLNGRRVMTPTKGVYIINGKKVVIK